MTDKSYSIIFSSPTGNTRLLADAIRDALPEENCNYFGVSENADTQSDILFIGFWTDKGTADKATLDLLEKRHEEPCSALARTRFPLARI